MLFGTRFLQSIKIIGGGSRGLIVSVTGTISFPEHARSQVKGGHSSGEIELIQACDWLTADSTLDFQREFYACLTSCKI